MLRKPILYFLFLAGFLSLRANAQITDAKATPETKNLYNNLIKLMDKGIMFGHQDAVAYGVEWKDGNGKSDVYDVVNDYPAVYGWDIGKIEHRAENNLDGIPFAKMKQYIKEAYDRGGINTISWHVDNPVTMGPSWDTANAVKSVLKGGKNHRLYKRWLNNVARFMKSLKGSDGKQIPVLFRPYHELNGHWFWWGKTNCSIEEYTSLWKFTADYLKDKKKVHNLVYIYNTNTFASTSEFLERYPGDDYADMMSFDTYQFSHLNAPDSVIKKSSQSFKVQIKNGLSILDSVSKAHGKIPALAETGYETIPDKSWWTETLWDALKDYKISYVLVWRNHGWQQKENKFHYYAPYKGHKSAEDFKKFYELEGTLFRNDIAKKNVYK